MSSIFIDKSVKPDNQMLAEVLGTSYKLWEKIKSSLINDYGKLDEDWKYYGQKIGWTLKLLYKKRNLFFFTPYEKYFQIAFVFGDKAVAVVGQSDLSLTIIDEIKNARKYAEGERITYSC